MCYGVLHERRKAPVGRRGPRTPTEPLRVPGASEARGGLRRDRARPAGRPARAERRRRGSDGEADRRGTSGSGAPIAHGPRSAAGARWIAAEPDPAGDARRGLAMTKLSYVDASALVKLVIEESDSAAMLRWYVESETVVTSRIAIIETSRASRRTAHDRERLRRVLDSIAVIECDAVIADGAAA